MPSPSGSWCMASAEPRILAVNPGSTSTKLALYEGDAERFAAAVRHGDDVLGAFAGRPILDQLELRLDAIRRVLAERGVGLASLAAVAGRGGLLQPVPSGTYRVGAPLLEDLRLARRGEHAANLGPFLADRLAAEAGVPAFIVDPVAVDEWEPVARLSGLAGLDRECLSHALNTKAVCHRFAREQERAYPSLRLLVAHLGSGISVSAHRDGRMVDVNNSREEGPFSMDRAGSLPAMRLLELAASGTHDREALERRVFLEGGVYSYLGTRDLEEVLRRAERDAHAALVLDAMLYQTAKEIGAMATVLDGRVDAILLTGGMAHARRVTDELTRRIGWIAPVTVYPGEDELAALAAGALRVLRGQETARPYSPA
jgi:butyrate kinase